MRNYILDKLENCIDDMNMTPFMKGYVYALVCKSISDDRFIFTLHDYGLSTEIGYMEHYSDIRYGNEVDIPEFMKKDNVVKLERRKDEV